MPRWIGKINVSGPEAFVIEAPNEEAARERLYARWLEACENALDRSMEPYTPERADELEAEEDCR
jgi:hypothetical protein